MAELTEAGLKTLVTGATMVLGGMVPAFSIGWLTRHAMEALGRNPEAESAIRMNMILGIVFCEAIAIYALVVALLIKFV